VLQVTEATTPMRQLYFVAQSILINPQDAEKVMVAFRKLYDSILLIADEPTKEVLRRAGDLVEADRIFEALKVIRTLFEPDERSAAAPIPAAVQAA
jgi:flagellar protein FlbT